MYLQEFNNFHGGKFELIRTDIHDRTGLPDDSAEQFSEDEGMTG